MRMRKGWLKKKKRHMKEIHPLTAFQLSKYMYVCIWKQLEFISGSSYLHLIYIYIYNIPKLLSLIKMNSKSFHDLIPLLLIINSFTNSLSHNPLLPNAVFSRNFLFFFSPLGIYISISQFIFLFISSQSHSLFHYFISPTPILISTRFFIFFFFLIIISSYHHILNLLIPSLLSFFYSSSHSLFFFQCTLRNFLSQFNNK